MNTMTMSFIMREAGGYKKLFVAGLAVSLLMTFYHLFAAQAYAFEPNDTVRTDTPSGFPVPRYVSLKSNRTHCRTGPSLQHSKRMTFNRKGVPVKVIAETHDHWRKIEDIDGDQCWVHGTLLSGIKTAMIIGEAGVLRVKATENARIRATLEPGVITIVKKCRDEFCLVSAGPVGGWLLRSHLWGYRG